MQQKENLRKKILIERKKFSETEHFSANNSINESVNSLLESCYNKNANLVGKKSKLIIGLYWPLKGEPDLLKLVIDTKYLTAIPKIKDQRMDFVKYEMGSGLEISLFNKLMQPVNNIKIIPDIVILPGLGFSLNGHRLGFGAGHYDKYLDKNFLDVDKNVIKIGVCFHDNLYEHLPSEPHDIKMNYIITDQTIIDL